MDTKHVSEAPGAYETRDTNPQSLLRIGGVLMITVLLACLISLWIYRYFKRVQSLGPPATPFAEGRAVPPLPQLQVQPAEDLEKFREQGGAELDHYGWVDRTRGIVHIPIDRAMDLLLERGLPTRPGAAAPQKAGEPAKTPAPAGAGSHGTGN